MTKARSNATAEAAKGDLRVGNGTNLSGILAVGSNGDTIVADSSTATGLRYQAPVNSNPVLNSAFQVWQRGTSGTITSGIGFPSADRWNAWTLSSGGSVTVSRQVTGDTTNLPFIQYCARFQRVAGNTSTSTLVLGQAFETVNSIPYAGKTVTVSFYARKGANYSSASDALILQLLTNTTTDSSLNGMFSGAATPVNAAFTLTSTWQRFTATGTIASSATQLSLITFYNGVGTAGANDYFEITGIQLEVGSVATPYKPTGATFQGELAACQRYYWRSTANGSNAYLPISTGMSTSATVAFVYIKLPISMRIYPSTVAQSGLCISDLVNYNLSLTNIAWTQSSPDMIQVEATHGTGATQYRPAFLRANNSSTAYLEVSAEL